MRLQDALEQVCHIDRVVLSKAALDSRTKNKPLEMELFSAAISSDCSKQDEILKCIADCCDIKFFDSDIDGIVLDTELMNAVSYSVVETSKLLPFILNGKRYLGMGCPVYVTRESIVSFCSKYQVEVEPVLLSKKLYNSYYVRHIKAHAIGESLAGRDTLLFRDTQNDIALDSQSSEIAVFIYRLIKEAYDMHASDIHFMQIRDKTTVTFKIDGKQFKYSEYPISTARLSNKIKSDAHMGELNPAKPADGKLKAFIDSSNTAFIELRVHIMPTIAGPDIALRILDSSVMDIDTLGMSDATTKAFKKALSMKKGLVLITGPVGSGKTSTLNSGLKYILKSGRDIASIEDPTEVNVEGVSQLNISQYIDFHTAIREFLRHNSDVMSIAEIRDLECVKAVLEAAMTGSLVIATLHTNGALETISRLLNLGARYDQIAETLIAVVSQRLVRRVCPHCAKTVMLSQDSPYRELYGLGSKEYAIKEADGCDECNYLGYQGRLILQESIFIDGDFREAIESKSTQTQLRNLAKSKKFRTLAEDALSRVLDGSTTFEEIQPLMDDLL